MSAADQAASAAKRPAFADANWNHEVCAIAYSYEGVPQEIARRRSSLRPMHKENSAQTEERRRLDELERKAAEHLPNIPKCKGQFYRPALERICDTLGRENRFCAQLSGVALPGVDLVGDEAGFARGLAWNKVGNLYSQGMAFAPAPWVTSDNRRIDMARPASSGIAYIAATNNAVKGPDLEPAGQGLGQWAFSVEMQRRPWSEMDSGQIESSSLLAGMTGLPAMGHHGQFPRLHFQAQMYDILVADDKAAIAVVMRDGTQHSLRDPALFGEIPDSSPAFYSSFSSYRIHAVALPTADEMRLILDPAAAFLSANFAMRLEDGRIDTVTLRTPLTGIAEAWKAMNAANLEAHWRIRREERAGQAYRQ